MRSAELTQLLLDDRCIDENPAIDYTVVDIETALGEHLFQVSIAERIVNENFQAYGVRSYSGRDMTLPATLSLGLWGHMGLQGIIRGKPVKTTVSDKAAPCPLDRVNQQFQPCRTA